MLFEGRLCRLRAVEPADVDTMYVWENDVDMWRVSASTAPCSRHALVELVESMRYDIYASRQLRLLIESVDGEAVGAVDLYDFDPRPLVIQDHFKAYLHSLQKLCLLLLIELCGKGGIKTESKQTLAPTFFETGET